MSCIVYPDFASSLKHIVCTKVPELFNFGASFFAQSMI